MSKGKAIALGLVAFVALIGLLIVGVFYATSGITDTADEFFAEAREGDFDAAKQLTSQRLQSERTGESLGKFLEQNGLNAVTETSWSSRSINNDRGELEGTVTTQSGAAIPIKIEFVYEQEEWRITYIDVETVGLSDTSSSETNDADLELVGKATRLAGIHGMSLAQSIQYGDFETFSEYWVDDAKPSDLKAAFTQGPMSDEDISELKMGRAVVDSAIVDDNGNIAVEARFPLVTGTLEAQIVYQPDDDRPSDWDILGFNISFPDR